MIKPLIETYKCRHWQIQSLTLYDCRMRDSSFSLILKEISKFGKKLEKIDFT